MTGHAITEATNALALTPFACIGVFVLPTAMNMIGVETGESAVEYYAEIHTSTANSLVHTVGMPFVAYGTLLIIPAVFRCEYRNYIFCQKATYVMFMAHYLSMNANVGLATALVYSVPTAMAIQKTTCRLKNVCSADDCVESPAVAAYDFARLNLGCYGALTMAVALCIQEVVGHAMTNDPSSRAEGVINAILYAMYYSIAHLFEIRI